MEFSRNLSQVILIMEHSLRYLMLNSCRLEEPELFQLITDWAEAHYIHFYNNLTVSISLGTTKKYWTLTNIWLLFSIFYTSDRIRQLLFFQLLLLDMGWQQLWNARTLNHRFLVKFLQVFKECPLILIFL